MSESSSDTPVQQALDCTRRLTRSASWEWDPAAGQIAWSEDLVGLLGDESRVQPQASTELLLAGCVEADVAPLSEALARAVETGELAPLDVRVLLADGELRILRISGMSWPPGGHAGHLLGVIHDVTAEVLARREVEMRSAASEALSRWTGLDRSASDLLKAIATPLGCEVATLWIPEGDVMVSAVTWAAERVAGTRFDLVTRDLRAPRGIGLAGSAWERQRPVDVSALSGPRSYPRRSLAAEAGLRTAVAVPALYGPEVVAVIDLHWPVKVRITDSKLRTLTGLGHELGRVLGNRPRRLGPNPLTPRELEILAAAADGNSTAEIAARLMIERSTVKTHLDHIYEKLRVNDRAAAVARGLRRGLIE